MQITKCFEILQVESDAPWQVVKKSYYTLAKKLHPDVNTVCPDAELKFKEINQAFQVLRTHFRRPSEEALVKVDTSRNTWNALWQSLRKNPRLIKWKEDFTEALIKLDTLIFNLNIHKKVQVPITAKNSGASIHMKAGREKFDVKIPAGDWSQMSLCIPGKGETSLFSKRRGDLILNLQILKNETVTSGESSLFYEMDIDRNKLGRVMTLNSSEGPIRFVLPGNTVDGQTFCLKSRLGSRQKHILKVKLVSPI
ncbi:MAG: DnaJ domain-containing protein [Nitrospinota bacterium]